MGLWDGLSFREIKERFPELYERLAGQPSPEAPGTVRTAKKQDAEPARVQQARKRAGEAAQPG